MSRIVQFALAAALWLAWGIITLTIVVAAVSIASAHDAPSGWSYPTSCCSTADCREVGDSQSRDASVRVFERPDGYEISSTGETIPMMDRKVRMSPDGKFHWCSIAGKDDGKTICLFVPSRGF